MRFIIEPMDCGNAAFEGEPEARDELARILRGLADKLENGSEERGGLYDLNGNRVAGWRFET